MALATQIEAAKGMVAERFAFCQSMPLDQFPAIREALRSSGYRPTRIRPFNVLITLRRDAVAEPHAEREEYNL